MTETWMLAAAVMTFLLGMAWHAERLARKDRRTAATATDRPPDARPPGAALRSLLRIAARWRLDDADLALIMGDVPVGTIQRWRQPRDRADHRPIVLTPDQRARADHVIGIHAALHRLFPDDAEADRWVHQPMHMPGFNGRSALTLMRQGGIRDLAYVRRCLEGWPA